MFAYDLDWDKLFQAKVLKRVFRPFVGKKIEELMGVEEESIIEIIVKLLEKRCTPAILLKKIGTILESDAPGFVEKLWRVVVFEDMKIKEFGL